jgi:glycosyltransferase involved in cell wall biosynthesis
MVSSKISLVTVTMKERYRFLHKALKSVAFQTIKPSAHHIVWDKGGGFVSTINHAVSFVDTEYFCFLDDDDIIYSDHIKVLSENLDADIVWTWCDVFGRDVSFNRDYKKNLLQKQSYIPSNHAMRTKLFRDMGGYKNIHNADWDMLKRCEKSGASFKNIPQITWQYNFHGDNISLMKNSK